MLEIDVEWTIERADDAEQFAGAVKGFLMEDEAVHNVALGLLETLQSEANPYDGDNLMAYVQSDGRVGGVAIRTPPYPGLLSRVVDADAAVRLLDALVSKYPELDGLNVPEQTASPVLAHLESLGFESRIGMHQRLYRTARVDEPAEIAGEWRLAEDADRELVAEWIQQFQVEVDELSDEEVKGNSQQRVDAFIGKRDVFLWIVEGRPVSMAIYAGRSPHGVRIGYVYTPPAHREHGYASAVTAAATREALQHDSDYCFLYTDLANDTTNSIYPAIGYEPVSDLFSYELTPPKFDGTVPSDSS